MALLTLTPSRFGTLFETGSWAYVFADRAVTKLGVLITPSPITVSEDNGVIAFELEPNSTIDERKAFKYTVAAYDPLGNRLYTFSVEMPDTDTNIFDLIPEPVDLDACTQVPLNDNSE